jgi:hypothetical protein
MRCRISGVANAGRSGFPSQVIKAIHQIGVELIAARFLQQMLPEEQDSN